MFVLVEVPGARLVDVDRELVVVAARRDLGRGGGDGGGDVRVEQPQLSVGLRGGQLDQRQRAQEAGAAGPSPRSGS